MKPLGPGALGPWGPGPCEKKGKVKRLTRLFSKVLVSRYTNTPRAATGLNPGLTFVRSFCCPGHFSIPKPQFVEWAEVSVPGSHEREPQ